MSLITRFLVSVMVLDRASDRLSLSPPSHPSDIQGYRCRQSKPGDKSGRATGLGDVHAPDWTSWPLWFVTFFLTCSQKGKLAPSTHFFSLTYYYLLTG